MNNFDIAINELYRILNSAKEERTKLSAEKEQLKDENYQIEGKIQKLDQEIAKLDYIVDVLKHYSKKLLPARLLTLISLMPSFAFSYFLLNNGAVFGEPITMASSALIASCFSINLLLSSLLYRSEDVAGHYINIKKENDLADSLTRLADAKKEQEKLGREKSENATQIDILNDELIKIDGEIDDYNARIELIANRKMMALGSLDVNSNIEAELDVKFNADETIGAILKRERE